MHCSERDGDRVDGGRVADSPGPAEGGGWWDKLKGVFSNLVTVRRSTDEENLRITLQDKDYIRQRAWLQLEVAQLALMRHDQQAFRASLQRVKETLSKWFDTSDSRYQAVLRTVDDLAGLGSAQLQPEQILHLTGKDDDADA